MSDDKSKEIDKITGVETTGHEWDGIKELNNPAPRWWLWVFFVCCIWAVGYWVVYPAWPTISGEGFRGGTIGTKEWTQYKKLEQEQAEIEQRRSQYMKKFHNASFKEIQNDPSLYEFALAGGKAAFKDNCATCHGTGGEGGHGYPNLNDDDWLWGGKTEEIYQTLKYGIRSGHDEARISEMPAFGKLGILNKDDIYEVASHVLSLSGKGEDSEKGATIFGEQCSSCHGEKGQGNREVGAPNLADAIWLYGDKRADIIAQVQNPKHGVMPTWEKRLSDDTIRQLTIYVHSLGGGE